MYRLGIDLGGTNIVVGVVDENFKIIATAKRKTNFPRPAEKIIDDMADATLEAIKKSSLNIDDILVAGVGVPGAVNPIDKVVSYAYNLGFKDTKLSEMLKERTGLDFYLENDANAAAYGEFVAGAGRGSKDFLMITLGTGVGSGIIINGKLYVGSNYAGAELGHMVICMEGEMCTCGSQGCWEAYASASALIRQTKQAMIKSPKSIMWDMCDGDINAVSGRTAFDAMRKGDIFAKNVVNKYLYYLSVGATNIINIFQPDVFCIGGGLSNEKDNLIIPVKEYVYAENFAHGLKKQTEIKIAELSRDAGIIGAAYISDLYQ